MVDAVLFDLDGTLVDTAPDLAHALNQQRQMHGLPEMPFELIRPYASHGTAGLLQAGFSISPDHPAFADLRTEYLNLFEENANPYSQLFPGMMELLDELETRGIPWGVVTNKPARLTTPLLDALGLLDRAASVVSGDSCVNSKPHPEPILTACREIGVLPSTCVYIGDAERDIEAAHACGMPAIIAEYGYIGPQDDPLSWHADAFIQTPTALLDFLGY
ncbi:phosphoglycolate phosphatase [Sulfuriferula sp. AH1]|uniref:phosphoglycolate phosphatase n=1 Tax=Sulfuriferula sp. AH1 TaxID=1985873 RepID=UPI000B3B85A0|nr:phosphoglycolate phosphatase [Sulfuriferula sp. AH1]ARU31217.1 phosphoglycolate phosphatase [Sulfuriferula sp. AH1]